MAEPLVRAVVRWGEVALAMRDFYGTLFANPAKDTPFPDDAFARLIDAAGGPP